MTEPDTTSPISRLPRREPERSRRRRRGQLQIPRDAEGRSALLASLSRRAYPTYELFVFAALSGAILALGYLLDSQALLLFGVLVAPLLLPWVGLLLGTITGSLRYFFETLMALLVSAGLVFGIGLLAGVAARAFLPLRLDQAYMHSRLWWPDLVILALGAIILTVSFVRSEAKPFLPSVILAYEFFPPVAAGAFGLGSGVPNLWPHGLLVFVVHFAWAGVFGLLTMLALRMAPTSAGAFVFSAAVGLVLLAILVVLMSSGTSAIPLAVDLPGSAPTPEAVAADPGGLPAEPAPTETMSATAVPATSTSTALPTVTATITLTIEPTPVYAQVSAPRGGAVLRDSPGGEGLTTLDNLTYVQVLPETDDYSGYTWVHVMAINNGERMEGWMVDLYLETTDDTPPLAPLPSDTPAP